MNSPTLRPPTVPRGVSNTVSVLSVMGVVALAVTAMLGFEEGNAPMLWVSAALALGVPVTVSVHLSLTHTLTRDEKRIWLREFGSAEVWSAISDYLSSSNLSESAKRRSQAALVRQKPK